MPLLRSPELEKSDKLNKCGKNFDHKNWGGIFQFRAKKIKILSFVDIFSSFWKNFQGLPSNGGERGEAPNLLLNSKIK